MSSLHKKRTTAYYQLRNLVPSIVFITLVVVSCGKPPVPSLPSMTNPVYRPLLAVDIEIDTPPLYHLGHEVTVAVAHKIDAMATRINSGGIVIFVCLISSRSFEDCPVSFETPPIPAFVLPPPVPHCGSDPYTCSTLKAAYQKAFASWQVIHNGQVKNLDRVRSFVHTQTDKIRSLKFPYDDKGSDIFGALATASQNFQGLSINVPKYLVLATDFVSTTTIQDVGSFSLAGVSVSAIYRTCRDNAYCQQSNSYWSSVVRSAGATGFQTYSPAASVALGLTVSS